uniref:Uncharacterized protein n=1 Tax=Timema monikensis TaxID=170555 RepID=A0A7R9E8X1_9NEOP|nr:unnamed protein product [Timema monikensis]
MEPRWRGRIVERALLGTDRRQRLVETDRQTDASMKHVRLLPAGNVARSAVLVTRVVWLCLAISPRGLLSLAHLARDKTIA